MPLETDVVSELDGHGPFVDAWRALAVARGNLFVTPEWYLSWLETFGDRFEPRLILCHEDSALVGVLPLVQERRWPRALRFAGDASADRLSPVVHPGATAVEAELFAAAGRLAPSIFVLTHLESTAVPFGSAQVRGRAARLPYADISDGWDSYLARRSRNFRADLKRKERALAAAHAVGYRRTESAADLQDDLTVFFRLHDERWDDRGGSASSTDRVRAFLRLVAGQCLERGWLRLWQLVADERPAASFLGWSLGPVYSYYLAGFDSELGRHSPGTVLLAHTIRDAVADRCERYDLLLGDERYKERFADGVDVVQSSVLGRRSSPAFQLAWLEATGRTTLRRLPEGPRALLQRTAARMGTRLPMTRTR